MDLFNMNKKKIEKLKEEKAKLEKLVGYVDKKKPKLMNNGKKRESFLGTSNCEICTKRTTYDVVLNPNESAHVFCSECEKEINNSRIRLSQIDNELSLLGQSSKTNSKPKTLTLNNKNNKRR